ncbi:MAG: DUF1727 domain-containing protein [Sciscionella sp.]|nr:DUF1727 domain-containing protein [Sciscionella sp.]
MAVTPPTVPRPPTGDDPHAAGDGGGVSLRGRLALRAGAAVAGLSRACGHGGNMIGGRVALMLHAASLAELAGGRRVALVSGTNGKTTTTAMLAAALRTLGPVASNSSGANMLDGLTAAMAADRAPLVAGEVDEWYLPDAVVQTRPVAVALLNLSRDQLDRSGEIRQLADRLRSVARGGDSTVVVANRDDPYVVFVASAFPRVVWVAAGVAGTLDRTSCPACGHRLDGTPNGWRCSRCALTAPAAHRWVTRGRSSMLVTDDGRTVALAVGVPGSVQLGNAAMAVSTAEVLGVPLRPAAEAVAGVRQAAGRYAVVRVGQHRVLPVLAKNPAGWSAVLDVVAGRDDPLVIVLNAAQADGRDTSWLYDVPFDQLAGRRVIAAGDRAADLGVRLGYANVAHDTVTDPLQALRRLPPGAVTMICDYTSFLGTQRQLATGDASC